MSAKIRDIYEWHLSTLKSGKRGNRMVFTHVGACCDVVQCEKCQKYGNSVWIKDWNMQPWDMHLRDVDPLPKEPSMCIGCMNRERPLWKAFYTVEKNRLFINRIKREISRVNTQHSR